MIEFQNVSFQYNGSHSNGIYSIGLRIKKGEFVLLAGRSGCGKTTLTRCINGLIPHFYEGSLKGRILLKGKDISNFGLRDISKTVGSVFQDPRSQFFTTDTLSEVAFACENAAIVREDLIERVDRSVRELGIGHLAGRNLFELSAGERQRVAIASVYALSPEVYVLDEPSANLDAYAANELAGTLSLLKEKGATVVIAEHRLSYLRDLIDTVVYLDKGRIKELYTGAEFLKLTQDDLSSMGLRCLYPERLKLFSCDGSLSSCDHRLSSCAQGESDTPIAEAKRIEFHYRKGKTVLSDISFQALTGEVLGIVGQNGAGKSTLAELLCGLVKEKNGIIEIDGRKLSPKLRIPKSYFIMQDSDYQLFSESVQDELMVGMDELAGVSARAGTALNILDLTEYRERHPASLSGGQKQRVVIAAAYMRDIRVVIFDEPTSGLDGENMKRVSRLIREMSGKGMAVFVITHDYELLLTVCERVLHVKDGRIDEDFLLTEATLSRVKHIFGM